MEEGLELAKSAGFGGLDLNLGEARQLAEAQSVEYVKDLWAKAGVTMGGWGLPVNWKADEAAYAAALAELPAAAEFAAKLGCNRSMTVVLGWDDERPFKENWDFHVKRLRPPAEILKDHGHSLGLEFVGPRTSRASHKYGFLYTMDAMLALGAAIGTGNVGLLLDVWHCYTAHVTLDDLKQLAKEDVVYVHLNDAPEGIDTDDQIDNVRCLPGETGVIPLVDMLKILNGIGYDGPVTPEPFSQKVREMSPADAAKATAEALSKVWSEAGLE